MFSIVVFMSVLQQVLVGGLTSLLVAGAVGYGTFNYASGSLHKQVEINTTEIGKQEAIEVRVSNLERYASTIEPKVVNLEKRFDTFEALVIDGQKESRDIAYKILGEIAEMRKDTAVNSSEIGAIKVDIAEIKEKVK